jgi:hypothetical protein
MRSTKERLEEILQLGGLSVAELSVWLDCPRPTLAMWLKGSEPRDYNRIKINRRLILLYLAISQAGGPFIPEDLTLSRRREHLLEKKSEFVKSDRIVVG